MNIEVLPKTIALIPDGNRRWARKNKLSIFAGYSLGVKKFIDFSEWCMNYGINNLTVWALSSDNIKRNSAEVRTLFGIYKKVCQDKEILKRIHSNQTRINIIGNKALLPADLSEALSKLEINTRMYTDRTINMMIGYGGRDDLFFAAKKFASDIEKGIKLSVEEFHRSLMSYVVPDIDLIIRTSGERRLSGFVPWQSYYSELHFSNKLWPDFTSNDLRFALLDYSRRERRFGR